ncbi:multidrug efflux RND transporter permease subunit [Myxococcus sp. K15C18031901]|uniref:efflux RND transporter permease subunit n=1 Tax=Myxococcus dinghuensis TaxID=2906761 RepID=UPI0020A76B6A|nr:multidrug efflux RND transporter permease subunit [Myxococcus dinghuensis]MCP3100070.1 multidrug efflux RND transporter permease subunit [Myxococcus dinghuensis]
MFVDFFIRRPVFAIVCSILLTLVGAIAIPTLPISQYPDLAPPQVTVTSTYVGASAEVVESAVTIPIEQELNGVEGMRYITSTSGNDGTSQITVTFEPTRDIEVAAVDVQNRVSRAAARLPSQVNQTGIVVNKASSQMLMTVALSSPDNRYDAKFLSNYADVNLKDAIKRVRGVGDVRIFGERKFSMRVWLDPTELARRKLTPQDVTRALQEQNLQVAAGQVGQPPSTDDQPYQLAIRARGRLVEPEEFGEIVLMRDPSGKSVRVKDVGRVELGAENYGTLLRFNGKTGVGLAIFQLPTANALDVRDGVYRELDRLSEQFPPGMEYQTGTDTTLAVRASIHEVIQTLVEAIVLVILVIFLFLHGWRSVLITAFTLPVSLVGTFAFVKLMDFSINTLTLFGLTLATGLVVDDAIVVIENIERLMAERGLTPRQAAREGMKEVAGAVIAISIVLVAVFVPVALFPGTTGSIYRQFALTIAASVALSTFCALTLTPALSARMLKHHHGGEKWVFFRWVDKVLDATRAAYGRGLRGMLKHPVLVLLAFLLCIGGTVVLFRVAPTGFIPDEDQGYVIISIQGPEGMSLAQVEKVLAQVEDVLKGQPEVRAMFAIGGFSFQGSGSNMATVFTSLKPWEERPGKEHTVAALVERLRGPLARIGGARVLPFQPPAIRGVGSVGGFQFIVEDVAGTRTLDELAGSTDELVAKGNEDARLRGVFTAFNANTPLLDVEVDRQKAKALGIPIEQIFGTMQVYMGSQYVNDFNYANRTYRVYTQAEQQYRDSPADIGSFYVRSDSGDMIPLESLVKVTPTVSAQVIRHYNLFRSAEINGQAAPGVSSGQAIEAMESLAAQYLPQGMSAEWTGISLEQKESGGQTMIIFGLGLLFVFLVLAAQYESFSLPFVIILSVPLAIMGAVALQLMRGYANDVFCQVGLVMLVGLASKNAILIVEFAEQLRESGKSALDAVVEAAEVRLRPILMTSIAFLLGVVPLMTAQGAGAAARNSLGTAVFGGMLVSTVVNLIFIPGLYVLMQKVRGDAKRESAEDELPAPAHAP